MIFSYTNESSTDTNKRKKVYDKVIEILNKNDIKYKVSKRDADDFINGTLKSFRGSLCISLGVEDYDKICTVINKEIKPLGGRLSPDNYNTVFLKFKEDCISGYPESAIMPTYLKMIESESGNDRFGSIVELLDNTDSKHIYLSTDWHIFAHRYGKGKNRVNVSNIVSWCKNNIKDNDVFIFLGDCCFRYATQEEQDEVKKIFKSLPGIKILVLGNHDKMLGESFYNDCGFNYVVEQFSWDKFVFTHRPIQMDYNYPEDWYNIHGHIHDATDYNTTDGSRNINVYPSIYNGKPITMHYIISHKKSLTKNNEWNPNYMLDESTKRSDLPDSAFGIPEDRKFPLDTEKHVKSAIKLFGHAEDSKKAALAKRINKAAKKYGIDIGENTQCYKYLNETFDRMCDIMKNKFLVIVNNEATVVDESYFKYWYVSPTKEITSIKDDKYSPTLLEAVKKYLSDNNIEAKHAPIDMYVFIRGSVTDGETGNKIPISIGNITINDESYVWNIQHCIVIDGDDITGNVIREWSMAAFNPIIGINKPYILKTVVNNGSTVGPAQYMLSPDIISDKYLVVNENAQLVIVDSSKYEDCYMEVYEYVGDPNMVRKIEKAFEERAIVDNTFFYTSLTGKPLLTEDQIDYDESFVRVDPEYYSAKLESALATNKSDFFKCSNSPSIDEIVFPVAENLIMGVDVASSPDMCGYTLCGTANIMQDINGYFYENSITGKRTKSVDAIDELSSAMLKSIL